jgi:hypothetical protein
VRGTHGPYNTRPSDLGGAASGVVQAEFGLYLPWSNELLDIALRGPRDFGFAAWVMKTAKASIPASKAQPGFVFVVSTIREAFGGGMLPLSESAMYRVSSSTARGADSRRVHEARASGTE